MEDLRCFARRPRLYMRPPRGVFSFRISNSSPSDDDDHYFFFRRRADKFDADTRRKTKTRTHTSARTSRCGDQWPGLWAFSPFGNAPGILIFFLLGCVREKCSLPENSIPPWDEWVSSSTGLCRRRHVSPPSLAVCGYWYRCCCCKESSPSITRGPSRDGGDVSLLLTTPSPSGNVSVWRRVLLLPTMPRGYEIYGEEVKKKNSNRQMMSQNQSNHLDKIRQRKRLQRNPITWSAWCRRLLMMRIMVAIGCHRDAPS